jgi:hypothetical protein
MSEPFGKMVYLASPYTSPDKAVEAERFLAACKACGWLMNNRPDIQMFYSPIAHTHPIAQVCTLPGVWQFWAAADEAILSRSSEIWILCIPGRKKSTGVNAEIKIAAKFGLSIKYVIPHADGKYEVTETEPNDESSGSDVPVPVRLDQAVTI